MTAPLLFLLLSLGAYRITRLVVKDSLFDRQRERLFDRFPPDGDRARLQVDRQRWAARPAGGAYMTPRTPDTARYPRGGYPPVSKIGQMFDCAFCAGTWVSIAIVVVAWCAVGLPTPGLWFAAVAGLQALLSALDGMLTK